VSPARGARISTRGDSSELPISQKKTGKKRNAPHIGRRLPSKDGDRLEKEYMADVPGPERSTHVPDFFLRTSAARFLALGMLAMFTYVCTCGAPRKCHTNAGPSSRQMSHISSEPMSWSL
jgi:hypothetical protein